MKHPNPEVPEMDIGAQTRALSERLGLTDRHVFFNETWVPYAERQNWLLDADCGVTTHYEHVETTFAFRTRVLDYLWTGLPIVTTDGDSFADLVRAEGLGVVVPAEDPDALADALEKVLYDNEFAAAARERIAVVRERFTWETVLAPLVSFCRNPSPAADRLPGAGPLVRNKPLRRDGRPSAATSTSCESYLDAGGPAELTKRAAGRVRRLAARTLAGAEGPAGWLARSRVLLDGTPLLGSRTGVGRYTSALAEELASMAEVDMRAVAFTLRGWRKLRKVLPHGTRSRGMPVSARLLRRCWLRAPFPPIELFAGFTDVVHGTNFVLPPALRAAGRADHPRPRVPRRARRSATVGRAAAAAGGRARRNARTVVCTPTQAVADVAVERLGLPADKVMVTPLGVDPAWFAGPAAERGAARRLGLPKEYLLFVGAAGPRKALDWLLKAHESTPDLPPLVLAGPGHTGERRARSGRSAICPMWTCAASSPARPHWCCRPATRVSGCRCWRRWRATCRWCARTCRRCARSPAGTRHWCRSATWRPWARR